MKGGRDPEQWPVFQLGLVPGSWDRRGRSREWVELGGGSPQFTRWGIVGVVGDVSLPVLGAGLLWSTVSQRESLLQSWETGNY